MILLKLSDTHLCNLDQLISAELSSSSVITLSFVGGEQHAISAEYWQTLVEMCQHHAPGSERAPPTDLDTSIDELELSVRSHNCLYNANVKTIGDLVANTEAELLRLPNLGRRSLNEIKAALDDRGKLKLAGSETPGGIFSKERAAAAEIRLRKERENAAESERLRPLLDLKKKESDAAVIADQADWAVRRTLAETKLSLAGSAELARWHETWDALTKQPTKETEAANREAERAYNNLVWEKARKIDGFDDRVEAEKKARTALLEAQKNLREYQAETRRKEALK